MVVSRHSATTTPSFVPSTSTLSVASNTHSTTSVSSHSLSIANPLSNSQSETLVSSPVLSFPDPRTNNGTLFELYLRCDLAKTLRVCRRNCGNPITQEDKLVVKSAGQYTFTDKKTKEVVTKFGARYIQQGKILGSRDQIVRTLFLMLIIVVQRSRKHNKPCQPRKNCRKALISPLIRLISTNQPNQH